eukprot:TRINITY_DN2844_c0_g1_i1.p1 TRINITY_DN2844_c0_g1~~TRINITY_DN2844_c0_g1_i1.p1  ORF type:complete len:260 (+),score=46.38 TRINITY_DN2844_c0_g1_i1:799-1578(+)
MNFCTERLVRSMENRFYGYLFGLLLVNKYMQGVVQQDTILRVVSAIIKSGEKHAITAADGHPVLAFSFHDRNYLGAAHGLSGIVHVLLLCDEAMRDPAVRAATKRCLDWLLTLQYPSGNFPSSLGSRSDELVQWCHGGPGIIPTLCVAARVLGDSHYIEAARLAADDVWRRGLLRKGLGLCHGISGNAYALLSLYHATGERHYLAQAVRFAEFACGPASSKFEFSNTQENLFNGVAAAVTLFHELLADPSRARFPLFEL